MGHPDFHFSFPFIKKSDSTTSETYISEWKSLIADGYYFGLADWLEAAGNGTKQAVITDGEACRILDQLSVASYEGGYKVMIIWLPERMNPSAANTLLKMLEEPAPQTVFILVSNDTSTLLSTILSRTQLVEFPRLTNEDITEALTERRGLERSSAMEVARVSGGSYLNALKYITSGNADDTYFDVFVSLMRLAYGRDVRGLKKWSEDMAAWTREKQKSFLTYGQNMLRENFMYNFHQPDLNFMTEREAGFAHNFARFINERNIIGFTEIFTQAQKDIEQNVNGKTVFFDFALKVIVLIRR